MALIHTVPINGNLKVKGAVSSTRKSETRRYEACIVTTVTPRAIEMQAEHKAEIERELAAWNEKLTARIAQTGKSVAEAVAWYQAAAKKWHGNEDRAITTRLIHENRNLFGTQLHEAVRKEMVAKGYEDPYDKSGIYGVCDAASEVERRQRSLDRWSPLVLWTEGVISWHGTLRNAQKALGSRECTHYAERGYHLVVRTDITVRETRAKGASAPEATKVQS